MPQIELCAKCGKEILSSRYSWSKEDLICFSCLEKDSYSNTRKTLQNQAERKTQDSYIKKSNSYNINKDDVLITWPYLIKITFGIAFIAFILLLGFIKTKSPISPDSTKDQSTLNLGKK